MGGPTHALLPLKSGLSRLKQYTESHVLSDRLLKVCKTIYRHSEEVVESNRRTHTSGRASGATTAEKSSSPKDEIVPLATAHPACSQLPEGGRMLRDPSLETRLRAAVVDSRNLVIAHSQGEGEYMRLFRESEDLAEEADRCQQEIAASVDSTSAEASTTVASLRYRHEHVTKRLSAIDIRQKLIDDTLKSKDNEHRLNVDNLLDDLAEAFIRDGVLHVDDFDDGAGDLLGIGHESELEISMARRMVIYPTVEPAISESSGSIQSGREMTEEAKEALKRFRFARAKLCFAESQFDSRSERQMQEIRERNQDLRVDEDVEDDLTFDMRQLHDTQRVAQELTKAEEAYQAAKIAMVEANVQIRYSEISSGFVDRSDDGYSISSEVDVDEARGNPRNHHWVETTPDTQPWEDLRCDSIQSCEVELDDWDVRTVDIPDSWSMTAKGSEKRRLEKWKAICELLRT